MKKATTHSLMFLTTILTVLALSALQVVPVLADDEAPPSPAATEVAPPAEGLGPEVPPAEQAPAATAEIPAERPAKEKPVAKEAVRTREMPGEILAQVPEGTEVVALDESGEALPLASAESAELIATGDPVWCPLGVTPGSVSCSPRSTSFQSLISWLIANDPNQAGVIWIEKTYDSSTAAGDEGITDFTLNGDDFDHLDNFNLTIKGGWNGTGTGITASEPSAFSKDSLSILNWNGNITLSDIVISGVTGGTALTIETSKDINLKRVEVGTAADPNAGNGASLVNTAGTGNVILMNSKFSYNTGLEGLQVISKGAVTLTNIDINNNGLRGMFLNNVDATTPKNVTLTNVEFSHNGDRGLSLISKGALFFKDITAIGNGYMGAEVNNVPGIGMVMLTGINIFSENSGDGLSVSSRGRISASNLIANANGSWGVSLSNVSADPSAVAGVTLTGTNQFKFNHSGGLSISTHGAILLNNISANNNANSSGADLCNDTSTAGSSVTLTGINTFNGNSLWGLAIRSKGAVTLNNLTANDNGLVSMLGYGADIDNHTASVAKAVTLNGVNTFNNNFEGGLSINSAGAITLNKVTANNNHGLGVGLNNQYETPPQNQSVSLLGYLNANGNASFGLSLRSYGSVALSNVTASGNSRSGIFVDNCNWDWTTCMLAVSNNKPILLNGTNTFNDNQENGVYIVSLSAVALNNITANGNAGGVHVHNSDSHAVGGVIISGYMKASNNSSIGLDISSRGAITLANLKAIGNGSGVYIDNTAGGASLPQTISLTGFNTFNDNAYHGLEVHSFGAIALSNLTAIGNGASHISGDGVYLDNRSGAALSRGVTLTGTNTFNSNYDNGLHILSYGTITVMNVTANYNSSSGLGSGALLVNFPIAGSNVTLKGTNTFDHNINNGLSIYTSGIIRVNNLRADDNGVSEYDCGADIDNTIGGTHSPIYLTGSAIANGNYQTGLCIHSTGLISAGNLTATGNLNGSGAIINNTYSASPVSVTLTGIHVFSDNFSSGLEVWSSGAINLLTTSITANNNGLGHGGFGVILNNVVSALGMPQSVKLTGTNVFNGNWNGGLQISSSGSILASNLTANNNLNGDGVSITNEVPGAVGTVILTGKNTFNNNYYLGLEIHSLGTVTVSAITANTNLHSGGVWINNAGASTPKAVNILGTNTFNANASDGLLVGSLGTVTIHNLTAGYSTSGMGVDIQTAGNVVLAGFTQASDNSFYGISIESSGNISLTNVIADGNGRDGLYVNTTGRIALTCGSFTSNGKDGLELIAPFATLTGVFAFGNTALNTNLTGTIDSVIVRNCPLP